MIDPGPDELIVPAELIWHGDTPIIVHRRIPVANLDRPFWHDATRDGAVVALDRLDKIISRGGTLIGAMHHMTRSGSTLLCRQFSALSRIYAVSEPFAFQQLLERPQPAELLHQRIDRLVAAFTTGLAPICERIVIKWPSFLCRYAETLAQALPDTPAIFVHRDPVEVLESIARRPLGGMRLLTIEDLGLDPNDGDIDRIYADEVELAARSLAIGCRMIGRVTGIRPLDYRSLPAGGWQHVAPFFGLSLSAEDIGAMRQASAFDAKNGNVRFKPDSASKREKAGSRVLQAADEILRPALSALDALRPLDRVAVVDTGNES